MNEYSSTKVSVKTTMAWGQRNPFEAIPADQKIVKKKQDKTRDRSAVVYDLTGIFWNEQKPSAIINDLVVDIGSVVGLSTVKEIRPEEVVLFDGAKDIVLRLRQD